MPHQTFLSTKRIEALIDGVFAIAMTLLAFNLKVPEIAQAFVHEQLSIKLSELWSLLFIYTISFVILGFYWIGLHNQYNYIKYTDRSFLWLNILFLLFVGLIPFSTGILGRYADQQISIVIYGMNILFMGIISFFQWIYATQHCRLVDHDINPMLVSMFKKRMLIAPIAALIAIIASFISIKISLFIYAIVPLYFILPGKVDNFWKRPSLAHTHKQKK